MTVVMKANLVLCIAMFKDTNLVLISKTLSLSLPSDGFMGLAVPQCL